MAETAVLDGFELRFEIHGSGIPFVYTPGAFYALESSRIVAEALVPLGYQVLLWDRPNTGASGLLFEPYHLLRLWADKLVALFDHVGFSSAYVAGVPNGLLASLHFATWYPTRISGLVLVGALNGDPTWWEAIVGSSLLEPARVIEEQGMAAALELGNGRWGVFDWPEQFRLAPHKREQLLSMDPVAAAATLRAWSDGYTKTGHVWAGGLTAEQLADIDVPAIVFSGPGELWADFPFHGPEDARRLHNVLPRSELVISSEYLGDRWASTLERIAETDGYDPLVAALAARIGEFVRSCGG
jgi:2-hydroxy-6-oxonona-2,4-dienedioate hydrolase